MDLLFQCNLGSFFGGYGKEAEKLVKLLAKHHMIDFIGTDSHHSKVNIYDDYDKLKDIIEEDYYELLTTTNPKKIIKNEVIESQKYSKLKKSIFGNWK